MQIKTFVVTPFQENTYLIISEKTKNAIIIDPGGEEERLIDAIEQEGCHLQKIINTHAHIDHVGAVQALKDHFQVPFCLHQDEQILLDHLPSIAETYQMPISGVPQIDEYLNDGDLIFLDDITFTVLLTNGHSPGGLSFLTNEDVVFTGDALFSRSIGRTDLPPQLPEGNYQTLIRSIKTKLLTLPDHTIVYAGHGPATTIGIERDENPFL